MSRLLGQVFAMALGLAAMTASLPAAAVMITGTANLSGDNEIPPVATDAFGTAEWTVDTDAGTITVQAMVTGIFLSDITFAETAPLAFGDIGPFHIHEAPAGSNGPIVVPFPSESFFTETATGLDITAVAAFGTELISPLVNQGLYFNLHTLQFSSGELRGQLQVPEPATAALLIMALLATAGVAMHRRPAQARR